MNVVCAVKENQGVCSHCIATYNTEHISKVIWDKQRGNDSTVWQQFALLISLLKQSLKNVYIYSICVPEKMMNFNFFFLLKQKKKT